MRVRQMSHLTVTAAALQVFLATGMASAAGAGWPVSTQGGDLVVETPHYRVRTDLGPDVGQTVASHQEALYAELYRRMGNIKKPKAVQRFEVLVLSTQERYLREMGDAAKGSRGIFMLGRDVLACWGSANELDLVLSTLRHEGTHQFVAHFIGPQCPVWLNEGLATFFEQGEFLRGGLEVGQVVPWRVAALRRAIEKGQLVPVGRMLVLTNQEWLGAVHSGSAPASLQYHEAWAMVHFLAFGGNQKYRAAFLQFIYYIARGEDGTRAWEKTFGTNYQAFEDRWREYVEALQPDAQLDCKSHLRGLGLLLLRVAGKTDIVKDMATFRQAAIEGRLGKWTLKSSDGTLVSSDDRDKVADLFKCPQDNRPDAETSYELVPDPAGGAPVVRCRHHAGIVLETQYVKDPESGRMDVTVVARPAASVR